MPESGSNAQEASTERIPEPNPRSLAELSRLRAIVANCDLVLYALDAQGIFTLSEGRGLRVLGLLPGQVIGLSAFDLYREHPDVIAYLKRALSGEEFTGKARVRDVVWCCRYVPQRDENGRFTGTLGVAMDITAQQRIDDQRALLSEVSVVLGESLDMMATLSQVARICVPRLSDWCMIDLVEGQALRRMAAIHSDPAKTQMLQAAFPRYPLSEGEISWQVIHSGQSILAPSISSDELSRYVSGDQLDLVLQVGLTSAMVVPLRVRGKGVGVVLLFMDGSGRRFGPDDLSSAEDLAASASRSRTRRGSSNAISGPHNGETRRAWGWACTS